MEAVDAKIHCRGARAERNGKMTDTELQILMTFRLLTFEQKKVVLLSALLSSHASEQEASAAGPGSNPVHTA